MTLLAAERVERGVLNVATTEAHTVREAAKLVLQVTGHQARIATSPERPTGPHCRIASIERAAALLGTGPQIGLAEGIKRTAEWYYGAKDRRAVFADLESLLVERRSSWT
jgi:nucleoside-diphosphate-sugar epimerase